MSKIIEKNGKLHLPTGELIEDIVKTDYGNLYRVGDTLYTENGDFASGLSGNLLDDEELAELEAGAQEMIKKYGISTS